MSTAEAIEQLRRDMDRDDSRSATDCEEVERFSEALRPRAVVDKEALRIVLAVAWKLTEDYG